MSTLQGARIAGYTIEAVAGRGGMGVVYRARDRELDRIVALKVIAPDLARDAGFRARFVREARVTAQLDHPNVIPVYDAGEDDGRLFIAMRWVEGTDLGRLIAEHGPLEPRAAVELVAQAASALDAAHARGLVHRDVKPANLLLPEAARSHVYLTDFGLAKRDGSSGALTTTGHWLGTPDYASPEQIEGRDLDARADVYALGCVLYAALTGHPPFADVPRLRKGWAQVHEPPPALPGSSLAPVLVRALAKDPERRWSSAGELAAVAEAAVAAGAPRTARTARLGRRGGGAASGAGTARLTGRTRALRRAPGGALRTLAGVLALAAVAVGIAAALGAFSGGDAARMTPPAAGAPRATAPPPLPAPDASATVRCAADACTQGARRVQPPIEDGRCDARAGAGRWTRIDAGGAPLIACVPDAPAPGDRAVAVPMPDVAGAQLDRAEGYLDSLKLRHDTSGGGTFGIVQRDNWRVCATRPAAGAPVAPADAVKLFVDRSC